MTAREDERVESFREGATVEPRIRFSLHIPSLAHGHVSDTGLFFCVLAF